MKKVFCYLKQCLPFVSKEKYEILEKTKAELEKEVQRLSALISAETKDCHIGVWCNDCKHKGFDSAPIKKPELFGWVTRGQTGEVTYCKKHLHEICPEFEKEVEYESKKY